MSSNFIALHLGAGYHSHAKESQYKLLCKEACKLGIKHLDNGLCCVDVVTKICSFLEDSKLTNAGYGSNLTQEGDVECDAGIMESSTSGCLFAGVTCLREVKNPIKLAELILKEQSIIDPNGLIPPMVLAGDGAKNKAMFNNLEIVENQMLASSEALNNFKKYKRVLESATNDCSTKRVLKCVSSDDSNKRFSSEQNSILVTNDTMTTIDKSHLQDTIGVICVDTKRNVASGVSSGGIALKQAGRVGHAAHFGCGCWSFRYSPTTVVSSCTSGCGELLIKTNLAKEAAEYSIKSPNEILNYSEFIETNFLNSPYINNINPKLCGLLVVKLDTESETVVDFHIAHSAESFCVGHMTSDMKKPKTFVSRLNGQSNVVTQGFMYRL